MADDNKRKPNRNDEETKQVLTGDQEGDDNFGGRTGSGTSFIAGNSSRADLGAAEVGPQGTYSRSKKPFGYGGSSDSTDRESEEDTTESLEDSEYPEAGYAEQGRGAPADGFEGTGERTVNRETDVEGSSTTR